VRKIGLLVLAMSLAAVAALAQDTPTGIVRSGGISLTRAEGKLSLGPAPPVDNTTDVFGGGFQLTDYTNYTPPQTQVTTIGPCVVSTASAPPAPPTGPVVKPLDAGPVFNLNGPNGMKQISKSDPTSAILGGGVPIPVPGFPAPPPLYLDPGVYTVDNGAGGADIGPFSVTLTAPDPQFIWINADADLSIDRSAGVDITWTGGDPASKVEIQGSVSLIDPATFKATGGSAFTCFVDNTGDFFVTPDVLTLLPATVVVPNVPTSTLTVSSSVQTKFDAPGSDTSVFVFTAGNSRTVVYK